AQLAPFPCSRRDSFLGAAPALAGRPTAPSSECVPLQEIGEQLFQGVNDVVYPLADLARTPLAFPKPCPSAPTQPPAAIPTRVPAAGRALPAVIERPTLRIPRALRRFHEPGPLRRSVRAIQKDHYDHQ